MKKEECLDERKKELERESKYLEKLENDVNERLYDLLLKHISNVNEIIKKYEEDNEDHKKRFLELLWKAINNLRRKINNYNRVQSYRYIILLCNAILRYDSENVNAKRIKMEIIDEYTHTESEEHGHIPSNYQINEIRITYDAEYLMFKIPKLISQKVYQVALYYTATLGIIEPDWELFEKTRKDIMDHVPLIKLEHNGFSEPTKEVLALDSNILINQIMQDVGDYKINSPKIFGFEDIKKRNALIVTKSVISEIENHLEFELSKIKRNLSKSGLFHKYSEIEKEIKKRLEKIKNDFTMKEIDIDSDLIDEINEFYSKYIWQLEEITLSKIQTKNVSKKLRKLAQRVNFMPEEGDINLLAEVITLNKNGENVSILSQDKDFTEFSKPIFDEWKIKIFRPR